MCCSPGALARVVLVPGIPIYLTAGIVIVSVGEESMGLWGSIAYSCFVAQMIKLLGCALQQVRMVVAAF